MDKLNGYRPWFYAAAVYNAAWGTVAGLFPNLMFGWLHVAPLNYPSMWQCIGMMVGVYAIGYWLIARNPSRFGPFVYIGLLGKILGPLGFVYSAYRGELPWSFGWINVTNDLIWLPAFLGFTYRLYQAEGLPF